MTLIERLVRFSWEVISPDGGGKPEKDIDRSIYEKLIHRHGFSSSAFSPPPSENVDCEQVMQAIARPIMAAAYYCNRPVFSNPWDRLEAKECAELMWSFGFKRTNFLYLFHVASGLIELDALCNYIGASYAFTTQLVPMVVSFEDVLRALEMSRFNETHEFKAIQSKWFLIVKYPLGSYRRASKVGGDMFDLLEHRRAAGRFTMFIDVADAALAREARASQISRQSVVDMVSRYDAGGSRVRYLLSGTNTFISMIPQISSLN